MPSRRDFLAASAIAATLPTWSFAQEESKPTDLQQGLLAIAREHEAQRRRKFAAVASREEALKLQRILRNRFLSLLDGLPKAEGPPPARVVERIEGDGYTIDKIVYQSLPDYHVPALLYLPAKVAGEIPGIISPCGHAETGKAADSYQILHLNLAQRGYAVLTYDPVGQGERSQYWDAARKRSKYNLTCGEHAVLGNPLYLLGTSLAKYRIWDGIRAIDYLASLPRIDAARIGCVGNSGGGTLSAYISALDDRVKAAVISCYITTLPRRMANRIEADPDADPEQDIFGFVSEGIDHAGLLALRAPRPTLVCSAQFDFFPIEGAKESCEEAKAFFSKFDAEEKFSQAIAPAKHGLSLPLRELAMPNLLFAICLSVANLALAADPPADLPGELKPLDRYAGKWEKTFETITPEKIKKTGTHTATWILKDRFLQETGRDSDGTEYLSVMGYDPQAQQFKLTFFQTTGFSATLTGSFDAATNTFTWKDSAGGFTGKNKFIDANTYELDYVAKTPDGKIVFELKGTAKRVKER